MKTRTKIDLEPRVYRDCEIIIGKNNVTVNYQKVEVADAFGRLKVVEGQGSEYWQKVDLSLTREQGLTYRPLTNLGPREFEIDIIPELD